MRRDTILLSSLTSMLVVGSMAMAGESETPGRKVLKAWGDFFSGGTWTTNSLGTQHQHKYRTVLNGNLIEGALLDGKVSSKLIVGVDPQTKKCKMWHFLSDDTVIQYRVTQQAKGKWLLEGKGNGPKGSSSYRSRVTRLDKNSTKEEMLEHVHNGEKQPLGTRVWKRKRERK